MAALINRTSVCAPFDGSVNIRNIGLRKVSEMEDELEDRIFYQTYLSHVKLVSKFIVGFPLNTSHFSYMWRILRLYVLKPEVMLLSSLLVLVVIYIQYVEVWSRSLVSKLHYTLGTAVPSKVQKLQYFVKPSGDIDKLCWETKKVNAAAYAIQGRRPRMEDRFVVNENVDNCGVSVYAVFDGHGGEFAADFAKDKLMTNLTKKIFELKKIIGSGKFNPMEYRVKAAAAAAPPSPSPAKRTDSGRVKGSGAAEEGSKGSGVTDPVLLEKMASIRGITRDPSSQTLQQSFIEPDLESFIECGGRCIDYGKLLKSVVLSADHHIVQQAKKSLDVAGTTALIAVKEGNKLIVANVGDSRGVMCDKKGNAIPLSFDHKPQQTRELKRIKDAGGFVTFNGVWRVAGILATSRALGDYPLKNAGFVIADPDVLTYDLEDHKPKFVILASDGLWDTFTNEEAVAVVKNSGCDSYTAARTLVQQAYQRGSLDNICVVVIMFSDKDCSVD